MDIVELFNNMSIEEQNDFIYKQLENKLINKELDKEKVNDFMEEVREKNMNDIDKLEDLFEKELVDIEDFEKECAHQGYGNYYFNEEPFLTLIKKIELNKDIIDDIIDKCELVTESFHDIMSEMREDEQINNIKEIYNYLLEQDISEKQREKIDDLKDSF